MAEGGQTGTTAHGAFLRGDALGGLRTQDFARLDRYGLRRVIDVRSSFEVRHWPDPYAPGRRGARQNVEYVHIPMLDQLNCAARFLAACRMCISSCSITMRRVSVL